MVVVMEKVEVSYVKNAKIARKRYPGAVVMDITIDGGMKKLDPEYGLGNLEVPMMECKAQSVLSIWEGLKVFNKKEEDLIFLRDQKKVGCIRNCKSYGKLVGFKLGEEIINYEKAIDDIFKKSYKNMIINRFPKLIGGLRKKSEDSTIVFLDYKKEDRKAPCSHGEILKEMIEN